MNFPTFILSGIHTGAENFGQSARKLVYPPAGRKIFPGANVIGLRNGAAMKTIPGRGRTWLFECAKCGFRATVAGGADRGFRFAVQTILCHDCKELHEAVVSLK